MKLGLRILRIRWNHGITLFDNECGPNYEIIRLTTFYMYEAVPSALEFQDNIIVKTKLSLWIIYIDDNIMSDKHVLL